MKHPVAKNVKSNILFIFQESTNKLQNGKDALPVLVSILTQNLISSMPYQVCMPSAYLIQKPKKRLLE